MKMDSSSSEGPDGSCCGVGAGAMRSKKTCSIVSPGWITACVSRSFRTKYVPSADGNTLECKFSWCQNVQLLSAGDTCLISASQDFSAVKFPDSDAGFCICFFGVKRCGATLDTRSQIITKPVRHLLVKNFSSRRGSATSCRSFCTANMAPRWLNSSFPRCLAGKNYLRLRRVDNPHRHAWKIGV